MRCENVGAEAGEYMKRVESSRDVIYVCDVQCVYVSVGINEGQTAIDSNGPAILTLKKKKEMTDFQEASARRRIISLQQNSRRRMRE